MGASIYYQPVNGKYLPMGGSSGFQELLRRAFGSDSPWHFTDRDAHRLETAAQATDSSEYRAALTTLAEDAMKHGEIRVWAEY